jgi:hypothetical protein
LKKWSLDLLRGSSRDRFDLVFEVFESFLGLAFGSRGCCVEGGVGTFFAEAWVMASLLVGKAMAPSSISSDVGLAVWFGAHCNMVEVVRPLYVCKHRMHVWKLTEYCIEHGVWTAMAE